MKHPELVASMFHCLLMAREKAEACMSPGDYAEDQELFQAIARTCDTFPWSQKVELFGLDRFLGAPNGMTATSQFVLNHYWLGEGATSLAWLLGVTPTLPPPSEPGDWTALGAIKGPHRDLETANHFCTSTPVVVAAEAAGAALHSLEVEFRALSAAKKAKQVSRSNEETKAIQVQHSRAVERSRTLAWAVDREWIGLELRG